MPATTRQRRRRAARSAHWASVSSSSAAATPAPPASAPRPAEGRWAMQPMPGSEFELGADLVLLAMGFLGPRRGGMLEQAGVKLDPRGNVAASTRDYQTAAPKIFAAGDMRRGQSLVVWAIREGRQCARAIDQFL